MKKILFICLICFVLNDDIYDKGPAANPKNEGAKRTCESLYAYQTTDDDDNAEIKGWADDLSTSKMPEGASDCVDSYLYRNDRYYDRCCYIRLQVKGHMHAGCIALTEEDYLDIAETMRKIEDGEKKYCTSETRGSKVYQIDCASSYLKIFTFVSALFALIF